MIRFLENLDNVNVDATKKAGAECKRGAFVTVDHATGKFSLATDLASVTGVVVRDTVVDSDVAQGISVTEYSDSQDVIAKDTLAGVRIQFKGEQFATDQFDSALTEDQKMAGKYLTVTNGKLATSSTATSIISLGVIDDAGHKLLGYTLV